MAQTLSPLMSCPFMQVKYCLKLRKEHNPAIPSTTFPKYNNVMYVHVFVGFKSLTHGVMGGLTSIAQQTYDGASQRGFEVCPFMFVMILHCYIKHIIAMLYCFRMYLHCVSNFTCET